MFIRLLFLLLLLSATTSAAQVGALDGGLLTLGGHSTLPRHLPRTWTFGLQQTYSEATMNTDIQYLETHISAMKEWQHISVGISANLSRSSSTAFYGAGPDFTVAPSPLRISGKTPRIQTSPGDNANDPIALTSLGDVTLKGSYFRGRHSQFGVHTALQIPVAKLDRTRTMVMQSTVGVPAAMLGVSYENITWHIPPRGAFPQPPDAIGFMMRYGASLAYRHHFGTNSMALKRADDIAFTARAQTMGSALRFGVDLGSVLHLSDDHGDTNHYFGIGTQPSGVLINGGVSLSYDPRGYAYDGDDLGLAVSLFASAPLYHQHASWSVMYRSWIAGLSLAYSVW